MKTHLACRRLQMARSLRSSSLRTRHLRLQTRLLASPATGKRAKMKILVYGAGNIGSLYAAKLKDAGHDVTILARVLPAHPMCNLSSYGLSLPTLYRAGCLR